MKFYLTLFFPLILIVIDWFLYNSLGFGYQQFFNILCVNSLLAFIVGLIVGEL